MHFMFIFPKLKIRCLYWTRTYQIGISWGATTLDRYFMSKVVTWAIQATPTPHISICNVSYGHIHQELRWLNWILSYQVSILWEIGTSDPYVWSKVALNPCFRSKTITWTIPAIQNTPTQYILIQNVQHAHTYQEFRTFDYKTVLFLIIWLS